MYDDMWRRRTSIIVQLGRKATTDTVVDYVTVHADRLSGLSTREALKVVRTQGLLTEIP